jgi:hypothetical protein
VCVLFRNLLQNNLQELGIVCANFLFPRTILDFRMRWMLDSHGVFLGGLYNAYRMFMSYTEDIYYRGSEI